MTKIDLRIAAPVWEALRAYHLRPEKRVEALSYVWAWAETGEAGVRILVPHTAPLLRFAPDCFERQSGGNVRLHGDVLRGMLIGFARSHLNCLINVHDHWFDDRTVFSGVDDEDDCTFDLYLRDKYEPALHAIEGAIPRPVWNLAVVLGRDGADARLVDVRRASGPFTPVCGITVTGNRHERVPLRRDRNPAMPSNSRLIRQRDFISAQAQASLSGFHALVVGCGGIGSILAESLGRVGVGALTLVDDDCLDATNLNRWQGGQPRMIGQRKADLLARRLRQMFPHMRIWALSRSVFDPSIEPHLHAADVIFGAVDADEPRYLLNRLALQQLVPYFDAGVAVTQDDDVPDFRTRIFSVLPGTSACLECSAFVLYDRASTEAAFLDAATAAEWRHAGYVSDRPEIAAPSVYALNQRAVGLVVTEFLNWVCGWRPAATVVTESWARGSVQRADRTNFRETPDPECPLCSYYAGSGSSEPLPRPVGFRKPEVRKRKTFPPSLMEHSHGQPQADTDE